MIPQGRERSSAGDRLDEQRDAAASRQPAAANEAHGAASGASDGSAKEVPWADDKSMQPEQYTFYREGTPPPSPPHDAGAAPGWGPEPENRGDDYDYDRVAPPAPIPSSTIWGFRRRRLCILLAAVALVVVIGIGVGVGVGVGVGSKRNAPDSQPKYLTPVTTPPTTTTTTTTTTTLPSSRASSPSSTSNNAAPTAIASCPAANNTRYLVPGTEKTFLRLCGIDYTGAGQAVDLAAVWTASMQACMVSCAGYPGCTACGWGVIQGDAGSDHRCWLKSDLQKAHTVRAGWDFAILQ